jgi:hypothetical protein
MAVWINARCPGQGQHRSRWRRVLAQRPLDDRASTPPRLVHRGRLSASDAALVSRGIELNRDVIIDHWDGKLAIDEVIPRLRQLP